MGANDRPTVPTLIPEPDGKGLIAYAPGSPSPPWRWRDGKWTPLPLPPDARGIPITMAWPRGDEGALFLLNTPVGRYLRFARYDPAREPTIQQWIQRLGHEQFAAREEASGALSDQGPSAEPELRRAAREHPDAEIRTRATLLLQALADTRNTAPPHPPARVGPYRVGQDALSVNGDRHGRTFIGAASVQQGGRNLGPGILILHPDGDANFYGGETTLHQWNQGYSVLPVGPGKDLWTPGDGQSLPAALMDLSTHRARARLPAPLFHPVAARADGSLYVRAGDPYSHGSRNLMLYRPAATVDNVAPLALASTLVVKDRRIAVGDDGAVWAIDEQGHLVRFDGTQWRTVDKADIATLDAWAPGRDGAMIMNVDPGWILCLPQGRPPNPGAPRPEARVVSFTKTLRELVEKNRRPILELFSHSTGGEASGVGGDTRRLAIVVDAHQNIWAMTESETAVLAGDHWIDGDSILKKIQVIARVGDGRRVYVCDYDYQGHEAKGYLAAYDTNARRFTLENAPPSHTISGRMTRAITDPTGNLWLATFPNDARLLRPDGSTAAAVDGHTAVFRDPSDVLWLNPNYSGDDGPRPFSLWRDGKILSTLDIPGSDDLTQLYSDPQGSLWAKTTIGLHRITPDPERPGHYTRGRLYDLPAVADPRAHVEFTPLGYVGVAVTPDPQRPEVAVLHLYKLPPPD